MSNMMKKNLSQQIIPQEFQKIDQPDGQFEQLGFDKSSTLTRLEIPQNLTLVNININININRNINSLKNFFEIMHQLIERDSIH